MKLVDRSVMFYKCLTRIEWGINRIYTDNYIEVLKHMYDVQSNKLLNAHYEIRRLKRENKELKERLQCQK